MGGLANRSDAESKLVLRYEKARREGSQRVKAVIRRHGGSRFAAEKSLLRTGWKSIGFALLKGGDSNDIFKAEAELKQLAPRVFLAVRTLSSKPPPQPALSTALPQ